MKKAIQEKAWKDFADWCQGRGLRSLPAHPWTVAYYARWCESRHRHPTIIKRIRAISRVHLLHCHKPPDRHPVVARTVRILESRIHAKRQGAALFDADDFLSDPDDIETAAEAAPAAARVKKKSAPTRRQKDEEEDANSRRVMRSTPKLVSRRPANSP